MPPIRITNNNGKSIMAVSSNQLQDLLANLGSEDQQKLRLISDVYPELANPQKPECFEILARAPVNRIPAGTVVLRANDKCEDFILVLEGSIRIYQMAEDGREVTLYRIQPGDICLMSLNSLLNNKPFNARAECDTDVTALVLNKDQFHRAMEVSDNFRGLVLKSLTSSVSELTDTFYSTVFERLDMRLACLLGRLFERANADTINVTHQALAQELGTTREVVSRLLKQFEQQNCISLARGRIMINDKSSLEWFGKL